MFTDQFHQYYKEVTRETNETSSVSLWCFVLVWTKIYGFMSGGAREKPSNRQSRRIFKTMTQYKKKIMKKERNFLIRCSYQSHCDVTLEEPIETPIVKNINSFKITEHLPSNLVQLSVHFSDVNGSDTCHFTWIWCFSSSSPSSWFRSSSTRVTMVIKCLKPFLIDAFSLLYVFWNVCNISISISLDHISKLTKKSLVSFWYAYLHREIWFFSLLS